MIPLAGAMFVTAPYQSQSTSRPPSRKANSATDGEEAAKKPKKVNSEIRKQQNRIASRNYREKRKRKLQYLQQLLEDGESPEQAAQAVEEVDRERMVTPEYHAQRSPASTFTLPSNASFHPLAVTSGNAIDPIFGTSYERQLGRTPQNYAPYETSWSAPMYSSSPNVDMAAWSVPTWMHNVNYTPSTSSRPEEFQYTPPTHAHPTFEQLPTPPQQSRTPDPDLFVLGSYGHCRRIDSHQAMGIPNASLPSSASSSPFHYAKYAGVP
ncbi:hypothetical protein BU23DRAFT_237773 [Bimuria novae-zelandiae CBS 107.79]|uniref:BZIP domain-containing protein n=1 Tax=Bimuria novae-zelandiae CBS 107.79 TaxID=1447943 RepID=A0A6A5UYR0_9PLEO|nr:hypothetical protein BU23DRAFT_237773 [Bimuria novae-zelandiae CBS 107.79]